MRKRFLLLLSVLLSVLLILTTVGCTSNRYKLTVGSHSNLLYEQPKKTYQAGETVVIKTTILMDASIMCFVNGESIGLETAIQKDGTYTHWEYYFEMPAQDVTVTFAIVGGM